MPWTLAASHPLTGGKPVSQLAETACGQERVAFIFNPVSGTQDPATRRSRLEQLSREVGLTCKLDETDLQDGARPLARQALEDGIQRVIVSGGDGSVAEAAEVIAGTDVILGVVPGGTGNLLAVNLGLPNDPAAAIRGAMNQDYQSLDVGRANGRVFLIVAGIGADARMVQDADRELKRRWGALAYFIAAWRNLGRPLVRYRITVDGETYTRRAQTVLVGNLGRITGGVELIPGADPTDGLLDVAIIRARNFRDIAIVALRAILGRHQSDNLTEIHRGRRIVIETAHPQPAEIDGNDIGETGRLVVEVEPGALKLARPEPAANPFPDPAALVAEVAARPLWIPLLAGVGTYALLKWKASHDENSGQAANAVTRHPWLAGVLAASIVGLAVGRTRHNAEPPVDTISEN